MKLRTVMAWKTRDGRTRRIRLFEAYCNMLGRRRGGKSRDAGRYWTAGNDFDNWQQFRAWSLANGYRAGMELDRKLGDLPYSESNCQWLTRKEHRSKGGKTKGRRTLKPQRPLEHADVPF